MAKFDKKINARKLRLKGMSLLDISRQLLVSKSSVSLWCRDIMLTHEQSRLLADKRYQAGTKGRLIGTEMNRKKKREMIEMCNMWGKSMIEKINKRDLLIAGTSLYWAEGSKAESTSGFIFVNSDPVMIKFMFNWLKIIMNIKDGEMKPRIAINIIHKPRINKVIKFWSDLLKLPESQFGNPWYVNTKIKKVYENHDSYYGILRLGVVRSGVIRHKMLSLIKNLGLFEYMSR